MKPKHVIIIDAGSSGSRLRIFNIHESKISAHQGSSDTKFETKPGLSSYMEEPEGAGPSLHKLINNAMGLIPQDQHAVTPLFVKATAGMRLLGAGEASRVFHAVREYLKEQCPFNFVSAATISGEEEAILGFISINSLRTSPDSNFGALTSQGVLDVGGASLQITYAPKSDIRDHEFHFYVDRLRTSVYAISYIRFGQDQAIMRAMEALAQKFPQDTTINHPCMLRGSDETRAFGDRSIKFTGTGNAPECSELAQSILHTDYECLLPPCALMGKHMTPVTGEFTAINAAYYTVLGLGLSEKGTPTPAEIEEKTNEFCSKPFDGGMHEYQRNYCFMGYFLRHTLRAFGFSDNSRSITYTNMINGIKADWTLGAALLEMQLMPLHLKLSLQCSADEDPCPQQSRQWLNE